MKSKKAPEESLKTSICNMKESAVNIPISTTLQFVLSDSGTILQMNPAAREALGMADSFDFGPVTCFPSTPPGTVCFPISSGEQINQYSCPGATKTAIRPLASLSI